MSEERYYADSDGNLLDGDAGGLLKDSEVLDNLNRLDKLIKNPPFSPPQHPGHKNVTVILEDPKDKDGDFEGVSVEYSEPKRFQVIGWEKGNYAIANGEGGIYSGNDVRVMLQAGERNGDRLDALRKKADCLENHVRKSAMDQLSKTDLHGERLMEAVQLLVDQAMGVDYENQD